VRVAGLLVALEGLGVLAWAGLSVASGIAHHARGVQLAAQCAYFVVLALLLALVASGLLRGRRWARSPALVAEAVVIAIGMWLAFPSGRLAWGIGLIVLGAVTLALLVTPAANAWIKQFPRPFGLDQDR
jgi:hypothetical protein